nr:hypothetical protein [Pigeon coronavirus]
MLLDFLVNLHLAIFAIDIRLLDLYPFVKPFITFCYCVVLNLFLFWLREIFDLYPENRIIG